MSHKTIAELEELFKQASQIAQQVPENMQEAAFNRALDFLTEGLTFSQNQITNENDIINAINSTAETLQTENNDTHSIDILSTVEPSKYPNISASSKVLDRSLFVLQIAYKEYSVDGLTPGNIAQILTKGFNISTKSTAICNALDLAPSLARRISDGSRFIYKIMQAGEDYLMNLEQEKRF